MRKKDEALRERLLECAKEISENEGSEALSIRALATRAAIATGTVYNYFSGKDDILLAITEEYWIIALADMQKEIHAHSFVDQLAEIYDFLCKKVSASAGPLMGSLKEVEMAGRERMAVMQHQLTDILIGAMELDEGILDDVWDETFTRSSYAEFITMNIMMSLRARLPEITFLKALVRRTLY